MGLISALLQQLLAAYTVLAEPFLRTNLYRNLKKQLNIDQSARILYYRTQILWEWSWVVVLAVIVIPIPNSLRWLGLTMPNQIGWIILLALILGIGLSTFLLRRNPGAMASMQRSLEASSISLPSTSVERRWFAATAVTAGICEELLYRGFLMSYLPSNFPMLARQFIVISIISGIVFGLSRAYLGMSGDSDDCADGLQLCNRVCFEWQLAAGYSLSHSGGITQPVALAAQSGGEKR